jgi:hypothetical protein
MDDSLSLGLKDFQLGCPSTAVSVVSAKAIFAENVKHRYNSVTDLLGRAVPVTTFTTSMQNRHTLPRLIISKEGKKMQGL